MITYLDIKLVLIVVFIAWHYALRCGFISDDHAVIEKRVDIIPDTEKNPKTEKYWVKVFNDGIVMYYLNQIMFKLGGQHLAVLWHTLNLALHLTNCFLLYQVLIPIVGPYPAIVAVLIWGINPMLNQCVVWVSGRPYLIATTLMLLGMLYWTEPYILMPLYLLAVITNISIAVVPILLKLIYPEAWQTTAYVWFMFCAGIPFILWKFRRRFSNSLVLDRENFRFKKRRFNTIVRIIAYYIYGLISPVKMGMYHQAGFRYNKSWEKFNIWTLISWVVVILLLKSGIGGWWVIVGLLPNINLFSTNSFVQERYTYFGSIGLAIIIAPLLALYPHILIIVVAFYVTRSYMYSRWLVDDEAMYRENWRNHPKSDYAVNNLAFFLIRQNRFEEARVIIHRGISLNNNNKMLWYNLGVTWVSQGDFRDEAGKLKFLRALECWKKALQIEPRWAKPAEDIQRLVKILVDNKVLTKDINESNKEAPMIDLPGC